MPRRLTRGQCNRRLHAAAPLAERLVEMLAEVWTTTAADGAIDSMPVPCCDNARIRRSKPYPLAATEGAFRGYQSPSHRGGVASAATSTASRSTSSSTSTGSRSRFA